MPGWRKLLTIEVRDVSRPGIFSIWKIINTIGMLILTGGACVRTVPVCWLWFELVIPESSDFDAVTR